MLVREHGHDLDTDELIGIAGLLPPAGHETTSNRPRRLRPTRQRPAGKQPPVPLTCRAPSAAPMIRIASAVCARRLLA